MSNFNGTATITYYEIMNNDFTGVAISIESEDGSITKQFVNFDPEDFTEDYNAVYANQEEVFQVNVESFVAVYESNPNYTAIDRQEFTDALARNDKECK